MEAKKHARELVRSSSYARNNTLLFLIFIAISILALFYFTPKKVYADNLVPTSRLYMSEDRASQIIDAIGNFNILSSSAQTDYNYNTYVLTPYVQIWNKLTEVNIMNAWNSNVISTIHNIENETGEELGWGNIIVITRLNTSTNNVNNTTLDIAFAVANFERSNVLSHMSLSYTPEYYPYAGQLAFKRYLEQGINYNLATLRVNMSGDITTQSLGLKDTSWTRYDSVNLTKDIEITGNNDSMIFIPGVFGMETLQGIYYKNLTTMNDFEYYYLQNTYIETTTPPSGDNSGDSGSGESGGNTGNVDLSNIENGITDINNNIVNGTNQITNQISGDTAKIIESITKVPDFSGEEITSGEITEALQVELEQDPYSNFWLNITTGLGNALTDSSRHLTIDWLGFIHSVDPQYFNFTIPEGIRGLVTSVTIVMYVWILARWIKEIINEIHKGAIITTTSSNILEDDIYTIYM